MRCIKEKGLFYNKNKNVDLKKNVCIYPTHPLRAGCDTRSVFKESKAGFNFKFSFSSNGYREKALNFKNPVCPNIFPVTEIGIDAVMPFLRVFVQDLNSVINSPDDNHYAKRLLSR